MDTSYLDTKEKIKKIALSLFREKGYDNVTLQDICLASSISKNTFYYHFKSKDDLLGSLRLFPAELQVERFRSIINADNYFEQYIEIIGNTADYFTELGPEITRRLFIIHVREKMKDMHTCDRKEITQMELSILKKAQEKGEIRNSSSPLGLMHLSFSLRFASIMFWTNSNGNFPLKDHMRASIETAFDVPPENRKEITPTWSNDAFFPQEQ